MLSSPPTRSPPWSLARDEQGVATVLAALLIATLAAITMAAVQVGSAVVARHRAEAGADMAALAAAMWLPRGPEIACRQAGAVSRAMGAALSGCDVDELDVVVRVDVATGRLLGGVAHAAARAGPVDAG